MCDGECFVERLDRKAVSVDVCRKILGYFLPPCEIPKDKKKVFEALAEQTHCETNSEGESDDEEDDDDGSCGNSASDDSDDEGDDSDDESGDSDDKSGDSDDESGDSNDEDE